jgi:hypothetical protein
MPARGLWPGEQKATGMFCLYCTKQIHAATMRAAIYRQKNVHRHSRLFVLVQYAHMKREETGGPPGGVRPMGPQNPS